MKKLFVILFALFALTANALATDVVLSNTQSTQIPFNPSNLQPTRTFTVAVTNGSATVTSAALFPSGTGGIVGRAGFTVSIGGTFYTVAAVGSTSSLTLTSAYTGSTGSATLTLYSYTLFRAYPAVSFQSSTQTQSTAAVTVTNGSATVTSAALFPSMYVGVAGGFQVLIGSAQYQVLWVASTSSLTLATPYVGTSGAQTITFDGIAENVQASAPGSGNWYKEVAVSVVNTGSGNVLYYPSFVVPATTNASFGAQARYTFGFYPSSGGSALATYTCGGVTQLAVPATTPTTWTALCNYNAAGPPPPPPNTYYNTIQIDQRLPPCTAGQSYYFSTTGNILSCLNFGSGLTLTGNTLSASGGGGTTSVVQAYNVKLDGLCAGNGVTNDTTCVAAAYTAALAAGRPLYFPAGTYLMDGGTLVIATNSVTIFGDGPGRSTIQNRTAGPSITLNNDAALTHSIAIRDLSLVGFGSGGSDVGLLVTGTANEPFGLNVERVTIGNMGARGVYVTSNMFTSRFVDIDVSVLAGGSNGIDIGGGADITLENCYVHTVGTNGAAYRIHAGIVTLIACNGIDSGTTADWMVLGDSTGTGDPSDRFARANLIGCNIEAFTNRGVYAKSGSYVNKFEGVTILAPPTGTVTPIKYDFVDTGQRGTWDAASSINTGGASYTNGYAVNSSGAPFVQLGGTTITSYYDTGAAGALTLPSLTVQLVAGSTNTAMLVSRAQITALESSGLVGDLTGNTSFTGDAARVLLQDGSAARPTFTFSGDTNTGFFRSTTDTIGIAAGGAAAGLLGTTGLTAVPYGTSTGETGTVRLRELAANGTDYVSLRAPDSIASSFNLTLPNALPGSTLCLAFSTTGVGSYTACSAGSGSPGGSDTEVQFNQAGSFGGITGATSDGTNMTFGSANLRATRPRFTTSLDDNSGNELLIVTATGSAVNEITLANAATGNNPTFTASGGDADVGINFVPKGSGTIQVSGVPIVTTTAAQSLTDKTLTASSNVLGGVTMTLGSDADGDMYYRASGVLTRLPKGTALQQLRMNAGATAPEWATISGGGTITGSGSTGTVAKFTGSSAIGDSLLSESGSTVTTAGRQTITGLTINADATNTVASLTANATFTKNNSNPRDFFGVLIKPTFNFGLSNSATIVNILEVDSVNTNVTGLTTNLLSLKYGGNIAFNVDSDGGITFANGIRQAFAPSTIVASLNVGQVAADPSSPVNGDVVYETNTNKFRCYENSAWVNCISSGANTALSNLASVAINTSLLSDTTLTDDLGSASFYWRRAYAGQYFADATISAVSGNQTINRALFSFVIGSGTTNAVITNSFVTTSSLVICTPQKKDATALTVSAEPASGSVTITTNAGATSDMPVACIVYNQ